MYVTPCVSVCRIDKETRKCEGCGRTIDQISDWARMTDEERMVVMRELGYGKRRGRSYTYEERSRRYDRG
jgi:predicted Fe-S protein YdhL (DUF1289 family)